MKQLGAKEVLLEFENEEKRVLLQEARDFLFKKFSAICLDSITQRGSSYLVWIKVKKVLVHAWNPGFFPVVSMRFGNLVCMDIDTVKKRRLDEARLLVSSPIPIINDQVMDVKRGEDIFRIFIEKDIIVPACISNK